MSARPAAEDDYSEPTAEELQSAQREAEALRQKNFSSCKTQGRCNQPCSFTWRYKVPEDLKPTKCKDVCLCEALQRRPVTFDCDFTSDGTITIA